VKARAPGKVVLSGAYAVLEGAPAIVSAVDRYVVCDTALPAERVTPEVAAALPAGPAPAFDASSLREGGQKLGLGSSAAIVVASLAAVYGAEHPDEESLRHAVEARALRAHRQAQGGGSGIDVVASTRGGTLVATRWAPDVLEVAPVELPRGLCVEAWASGVSASTPELLRAVGRFRSENAAKYAEVMGALSASAQRAVDAVSGGSGPALVLELVIQRELLGQLGSHSQVPIVTPTVKSLAEWAKGRGAAVLPSGAGGGDIVLWVSMQPSPPAFASLAASLGHRPVPLELHARGVSCFDTESRE
jgi:phosphomevalonate kinase